MPGRDPRTPNERLATIAGSWRTSGHIVGEPKVSVVGTDIYEVLAGGHFLVHHVDVTVGGQPVRAIEVIGEPDGGSGYLARSFDSEGNAELMHLTIDDDGVFHFTGGGDIASTAQPKETPTARVRSTLTIARDGDSMTALWERSEDGISWHPWMDIHFTPADDSSGLAPEDDPMMSTDDDLRSLSREELVSEVIRLRDGIRRHRDSTGHDLCWHHPHLWGLLPESTDPVPDVPGWPQFLRGCVRYRESLDEQLPLAPRIDEEHGR